MTAQTVAETHAASTPMDGLPASRQVAKDGSIVEVADGALVVNGRQVADRVVDAVAFSSVTNEIAYAADTGLGADLFVLALPDGPPVPLVAWTGDEDRPLFSPDGAMLAFVGSPDGLPSVWVLDRKSGASSQLTNVGVSSAHAPGQPPVGFVPPPDGTRFEWTVTGLSWTAEGAIYEAMVPRP